MSEIPDKGPSQVQARSDQLFGLLQKWAEKDSDMSHSDREFLVEFMGGALQLIAEVHVSANEHDQKIAATILRLSTQVLSLTMGNR